MSDENTLSNPEHGSPRRIPRWNYLLVEGVFACGSALTFLMAYGFWVQLQTRAGIPSSLMPLFALVVGCAAFMYGTIQLLTQDHEEPVWNRTTLACLVAGILAVVADLLSPSLWR